MLFQRHCFFSIDMGFYWVKTNWLIKTLFPKYVWDIPNRDNKVYLTFDDGPTPEVTQWTLDQLAQFDMKATFFCIGNNIKNHPEIFNEIIKSGHAIGNHTFNHVNGWQTETPTYLENVKRCEESIRSQNANTSIFRPPYGKIKRVQVAKMKKMGYNIIMWDVLSADFDQNITPEKCLKNVIENVASGSVIVFHDSLKAYKNLQYALPKTLAFLKEKGFECEVIR